MNIPTGVLRLDVLIDVEAVHAATVAPLNDARAAYASAGTVLICPTRGDE